MVNFAGIAANLLFALYFCWRGEHLAMMFNLYFFCTAYGDVRNGAKNLFGKNAYRIACALMLLLIVPFELTALHAHNVWCDGALVYVIFSNFCAIAVIAVEQRMAAKA